MVLVLRINKLDFSPDFPQSQASISLFSEYIATAYVRSVFLKIDTGNSSDLLYTLSTAGRRLLEKNASIVICLSIHILLLQTFSAIFCFLFKNHKLERPKTLQDISSTPSF